MDWCMSVGYIVEWTDGLMYECRLYNRVDRCMSLGYIVEWTDGLVHEYSIHSRVH